MILALGKIEINRVLIKHINRKVSHRENTIDWVLVNG